MVTLIDMFDVMRPLLKWMYSNQICRFRDIRVPRDYIEYARMDSKGQRVISNSTFARRLNVVEYLYKQRKKISDAISKNPWPHETALSLSGTKRGGENRASSTKVIPDSVVSQLAKSALEYVRTKSTVLLAAIAECAPAETGIVSSQADVNRRTSTARKYGFNGTRQLKDELRLMRTACYIVIDMFSGIRDSEMISLSTNCISVTKSFDNSTDIFLLTGTIFKTGVREKKWIVPAIVADAIKVLEALTRPLRRQLIAEETCLRQKQTNDESLDLTAKEKAATTKRLHIIRHCKDKLFIALSTKYGNQVFTLTTQGVNRELKKFCESQQIAEIGKLPYRLHAHQFRRTYAHFIARAELGDLMMLRDHFGHWSLDMTLAYASGAIDTLYVDTELVQMVSKEKMLRQRQIIEAHMMEDSVSVTPGTWLSEWRTMVRTAPNKESLIAEYSDTVTLNGTGHSWCVGNSRGTGCGGLCIVEATMCVDCNYGIIGKEHRPVWEGIRDQQMEALSLNDMGPGGRARANDILLKAFKVLERLDNQT